MESRIKLLGHPAHPIMITLPLGLLTTAVVFDLIGRVRLGREWARTADRMIAAGVVTGLLAGATGAVDWAALPGQTRAKQVATIHGLGNVGVLALFGGAWLRRRAQPDAPGLTVLLLELAGLTGAMATGWLGGELVHRHGVGLEPGANLDAPSTLSGRPASAQVSVAAD